MGFHGFASHHIFIMNSFIFMSLQLRLLRKTHAQALLNLLSFVYLLQRYIQAKNFAVYGLLCFSLSRAGCSHCSKFSSLKCPFSLVAVISLCALFISSLVFLTSSDCELFGQKFSFTMDDKLHLITRLCFQLILLF